MSEHDETSRCPASSTWAPDSYQGICPTCGAQVGETSIGRIKVHMKGVDAPMSTTGRHRR